MVLAVGQAGALAALDLLDPLSSGQDRDRLAALRERLGAARPRVLVVGEAKRGKSTLINALLGRPVLPTGVTPLTAVEATVILNAGTQAGEDIQVAFAAGTTRRYPLAALADFGTERGNPGHHRQVAPILLRRERAARLPAAVAAERVHAFSSKRASAGRAGRPAGCPAGRAEPARMRPRDARKPRRLRELPAVRHNERPAMRLADQSRIHLADGLYHVVPLCGHLGEET